MTMQISHIEIDMDGNAAAHARHRTGTPRRESSTCSRTIPSPCLPATAGSRRPAPITSGLSIREKRLVFDVNTEDAQDAAEFHLSLSPFRQVVKDYWQICESYFRAVKTLPTSQIEAIDMALGAASTTRAPASCRSGWRARPRSTPTSARRLFTPDLRPAFRGLRGRRWPMISPPRCCFCCDHNATRSPMAEGLMKKFYGHRAYVQSAGRDRNELEIDGFAVTVCAEQGVALERHRVRTFGRNAAIGR